MRTAQEKLEDNSVDEEMPLIDDEAFVESLVGMTYDGQAVYNYDIMADEYVKCHGGTKEEAMEYIDHNVIQSLHYVGERAPIVFIPFDF